MPDIFQDFPIKSSVEKIFDAVSTPAGLDAWWTKISSGTPAVGQEYKLGFGPQYDWLAVVTKCVAGRDFEIRMTRSDADWDGSLIGFQLERKPEMVWVRFHHTGWPTANEHFRISNHCWAMYLRVLRRYLEYGELVPYEQRLSV